MKKFSIKKMIYFAALQIFLSLAGCASSTDYNPSMDYNPGWVDQDPDKVTSFDQLPRHKNRMESGYE